MRYFVVGDVHWCAYSSILRSRDEERSTRLTNLLESVNWAERKSYELGCDAVVYLGDFFDKPDLTEEEITTLTKVGWNKSVPHYFLVGNHESHMANLRFSSTSVFELLGLDFKVVNEPSMTIDGALFVPYLENASEFDLLGFARGIEKPLVFSHNDISGIRYGQYESKSGFPIGDIESLNGLYVNGHLHNHTKFENASGLFAVNLGNLTGQNFSEDGFAYRHYAMTVEGDEVMFYENPHAIMFYKLEIKSKRDLQAFQGIGNHAVLCVKCTDGMKDDVNASIASLGERVMAYKIIVDASDASSEAYARDEAIKSVDHISRFRDFVIEKLGNTDVVREELEEICA